MPHVIVKLWPGEPEPQKARLARAITREVMSALGCAERSVSVSMQEIAQRDWAEKVYKPDILNNPAQVYKMPGYDLADLP